MSPSMHRDFIIAYCSRDKIRKKQRLIWITLDADAAMDSWNMVDNTSVVQTATAGPKFPFPPCVSLPHPGKRQRGIPGPEVRLCALDGTVH